MKKVYSRGVNMQRGSFNTIIKGMIIVFCLMVSIAHVATASTYSLYDTTFDELITLDYLSSKYHSHGHDSIFDWDSQTQSWSYTNYGWDSDHWGPWSYMISSESDTVGEKVQLSVTFEYTTYFDLAYNSLNLGNFAGSDSFDAHVPYYFSIQADSQSQIATDVYGPPWSTVDYTNYITLSVPARTGIVYDFRLYDVSIGCSGVTASGLRLHDTTLDTSVFLTTAGIVRPVGFSITSVPEPATLLLLGLGLVGLAGMKRKLKR